MGSINPVIITQESLEQKGAFWAASYASSITLGTGQFCTNPGLILAIQSLELDFFIEELQVQIDKIAPSCMLHSNIKGAYNELRSMVSNQDDVEVLTKEISVEGNYAEQTICATTGKNFLKNRKLHTEVFGPFSIVVKCENQHELLEIVENLEGQLTGTILAEDMSSPFLEELVEMLQQRVGRIILNGVPTGVEVCPAMQHGGPYPASTDSRYSAVGVQSINRWIRPIAYQNFPSELLPQDLQDE
jgi:NADP-dependent aldehyde dehydrogenase